jgi:integrase
MPQGKQAKTISRTQEVSILKHLEVTRHPERDTLGMTGCSSHSGRRTFITRAAWKVSDVGESIRDVQQLAGHTSLAAIQRYIEGSSDAKRRLVEIV